MGTEHGESSTVREGFYLFFASSSVLAAFASLVCYWLSVGVPANEGFNLGVILAALIGICGALLGVLSLACAYSRGTMLFGLAALAGNAIAFLV